MNKESGAGVVSLYRMGSEMGPQQHETVVFRDGDEQWVSAIAGTMDKTADFKDPGDASLQKFMSRPIKIAVYNWDPAAVVPFYQTFNPWVLFFGNKRVINRINNYYLMKAKLRVKFLINGNPFYYGRLCADYQIWPNRDPLTPVIGDEVNNISASQRLKVFLDPSTNQGGELALPMILQENCFRVSTASWNVQGVCHLREFAPLKHANGSVDPINITVYAWAEDVELSMPTLVNSSALVFQSGDEYDSRPVSNAMTNVAKLAGGFSTVPWIAPYAKATQTVANGLGNIAKLFGYSRPAQIENATLMKRNFMGPLANTDRGDQCVKLTLDSKQELTIDPSTVGLSAEDEMSIKHMAAKESYYTSFPFTTAVAAGTQLFVTAVFPYLNRQLTAPTRSYNTALSTVANMFDFWRGSVIFRFQIVASQYHKGRLLFVWDPVGGSNAEPEQNVQYSRIVDLSTERDFTMEICWGQPLSYLPAPTTMFYTNRYRADTGTLGATPNENGQLRVIVLNELTSPNSTVNNDIRINVFVKGGDDIEFNQLSDKLRYSSYVPITPVAPPTAPSGMVFQSGSMDSTGDAQEGLDKEGMSAPDNMTVKECVGASQSVDNTNDVYFGESIASIRSLLKRYTLLSIFDVPSPGSVESVTLSRTADYNFPRYRGAAPDGSAVSTTPGVNVNVVPTTILTYITPCFMGYRGGMRRKYICSSGNVPANSITARVIRTTEITTPGYVTTAQNYGTNTAGNASIFTDALMAGYTGVEHVGVDIQPALEVELPHYSNLRFFHTKNIKTPSSADYGRLRHQFETLASQNSPSQNSYVMAYGSVAEDFQLFLFQGQPPLYEITGFSVVIT